jgi:hypothetical protein
MRKSLSHVVHLDVCFSLIGENGGGVKIPAGMT